MDRELLDRFLREGVSLAEIGCRVGRHESTVAYWVAKYGLVAAGREKHMAKGRLDRDVLERLVVEGLSVRQIAGRLERSSTTVRRWLREYGLETSGSIRRRASRAGERTLMLTCPRHGLVAFCRRREGGYRCIRCRAEAVSRRRRKIKQRLVEEAGGRCSRCGYDGCVAALAFHHLIPAEKRFALSQRGVGRSLVKARAEAAKCVLLCANCHAEVEAEGRPAGRVSASYNGVPSPAAVPG